MIAAWTTFLVMIGSASIIAAIITTGAAIDAWFDKKRYIVSAAVLVALGAVLFSVAVGINQ
ncbi:hypothetical protein CN1A_76 [Clavibacter phage CN1A]|uniref:Uncharacterized protein n=1 Tax=Clavibacter phage CN1A TaxID=1406793 RepID=U5PTB0_9CAUD|nr:hypothetical protein CN1A_76 [Clavibacter phage CN1A]AGY47185.1 hypothetical protein CN1A_76 [Clavibacter phage CN1A]